MGVCQVVFTTKQGLLQPSSNWFFRRGVLIAVHGLLVDGHCAGIDTTARDVVADRLEELRKQSFWNSKAYFAKQQGLSLVDANRMWGAMTAADKQPYIDLASEHRQEAKRARLELQRETDVAVEPAPEPVHMSI